MAPSDKVSNTFVISCYPGFQILSRIRILENLEFLGLQDPDPEPLIYVRIRIRIQISLEKP
jgi:hypothetical protein